MADEATATIERPEATGAVNPKLQSVFDRTWGPKAETTSDGDTTTTEQQVADTPAAPAKPVVEKKPVIQHAELPPDDLLGDVLGDAGDKAKPEAKASDEIPIPEEPPASIKTEKGKADWKQWRKQWAEMQAKVKQYESGQQQAVPSEEVNNLKAQNQQLMERLQQLSPVVERANIELHPAFQAQFIQPRQQMVAEGREALETAGADPAMLERAMSLTGKARIEALDEIFETVTSPTLRAKLEQVAWHIDSIDKQKAQVLADLPKAHERLQQEERIRNQQQMEQQEKHFLAVLDDSVGKLAETFPLLREIPGNDEWNATRQREIQSARELLTRTTDPAQLAAAAVMATQAPRLQQWALNERKLRLAAEKELAELRGAEPSLGRRSNGSGEHEDVKTGAAAVLARSWAART